MTPYSISEAKTRYNVIGPQLQKRGWNIADRTQVGVEIPVDKYDKSESGGPPGITDYCLYRANGEVLAVVEAKRTSRDPRVGERQVLDYVEAIEKKQSFRPFAFLSNGDDIFFWESDQSAMRRVAGFFSRHDLERLLFLKQNRVPLASVLPKPEIAGRGYQIEAIRRIAETIEVKKKRKALLVMATGTGKTRTVMSLVELFLRARRAQKVLFLADRDALVTQAETDGFKRFLPSEARSRIRTYAISHEARVYVSTLQTLELCYEKFSPAAFDLIIADECHRSIYNKFTDVLAWFDAVQIGLTATPARFVDRDTFRFFDCDGAAPTFLYEFDEAVRDGYLADFNVYAAQTKFQRKGIKGVDLSDADREELSRRGIDPDTIDFEGTDLERKVTNADTLRRQWEEFMDVCLKDASGQLPGKSIVFAVTHNHAMRLAETFDRMYPEHAGRLVQVIDSKMERAQSLLASFKKDDLPRIAISVDMLDTGIDIPEVVNLAFMKPVNSQIKFWQMIGRGTRNNEACSHFEWLPDRRKDNFLIVDYWENFDRFEMMKDVLDGPGQIPVLTTVFNTRLQKLGFFLGDQNSEDARRIVAGLRELIARIPLESYSVKQAFPQVRDAWNDEFYSYLTLQKLEFLRLKVAPLLRFVPNVKAPREFFISKVEHCGLALLKRQPLDSRRESIREDVSRLPLDLPEVAVHRPLIESVLGAAFWSGVTLAKLDGLIVALADLMRYRRERPSLVIELGLDDLIDSRKWVILRKESGKIYVEEYRRKVEEKILALASAHPVVAKLRTGERVLEEDLVALERTLETELNSDEIGLDEENMLKAFGVRVGSFVDFLKHVLNLEPLPSYDLVVRRAFDAFIVAHGYNADQSRFLRAVQNVFVARRALAVADLYEEPFTNFGLDAVEKLFTQSEIVELIELTKGLAA